SCCNARSRCWGSGLARARCRACSRSDADDIPRRTPPAAAAPDRAGCRTGNSPEAGAKNHTANSPTLPTMARTDRGMSQRFAAVLLPPMACPPGGVLRVYWRVGILAAARGRKPQVTPERLFRLRRAPGAAVSLRELEEHA